MPSLKRHSTPYPGVYYVIGSSISKGKPEKIFYIRYRKNGKAIEEKAGRQFSDDMTPARASGIRAQRIEGKELSNQEFRNEQRAKAIAKAGKWTIDKLWEEYKDQKPDSKAMRTDSGRYDNYIKQNFGALEPSELKILDIDKFRKQLSKNLKPQTVKHILALLKRIINFGIDKGLCKGASFKITLPVVNNKKTEDLTPEQLENLLVAIEAEKSIQAKNMMKLVLCTGMRRGELFKLKWDDINFERGFITLREPKGKIDQKIPLNSSARNLLKNHPKTESPYVFPGRGGRKRTDINHIVGRIRDRAKLPKNFRPLHGLRHYYASTLASSGEVDIYTLQNLLGHKSTAMTQRYAHLRDETLQRAASLADDLIQVDTKENDDPAG